YGLGTQNQDLPGFITINPPISNGGPQNYGSCFLPAIYQGTRIGFGGTVSNLRNPRRTTSAQRRQLDFIQRPNREGLAGDEVSPGIGGLIESYELAFRMQGDLPRVMDLSRETSATQRLYGVGEEGTNDFGRQCLLARRFVEAGVRFVEVCRGGWD